MSPEKKRSTPLEVTARLLTERFDTEQLLEIYDKPPFEKIQEAIVGELRLRDFVPFPLFKQLHVQPDCDLQKEQIEPARIRYLYLDFGYTGKVSVDRYICKKHGVASSSFLTTGTGEERLINR